MASERRFWTPAMITAAGGAMAVVIAAQGLVLTKLWETAHKADVIIEKAAEIHTLTNKNFSEMTAKLEVAQARIEGLEKLVRDMQQNKRVADELAAKDAAK